MKKTILNASNGEIWLPKLKSMRILDLANIFSERYSKPVKIIGMRPGEKLHEDLISIPESYRVFQEGEFFRMSPAYSMDSINEQNFSYSSEQNVLSKVDLEEYLESLSIFQQSIDQFFVGPQIEEIRTK